MSRIYISVGTNINRESNLRGAVRDLAQSLGPLQLSSVYESEAVGFVGDAFYNMVIGADTELALDAVIALCKQTEDNYGRVRDGIKYCGRSLDLDLLSYDQLICSEPVELPRAEILYNAFVLQPLAEIAPDSLHPVLHQSYQQLWHNYQSPQKLWMIPFQF